MRLSLLLGTLGACAACKPAEQRASRINPVNWSLSSEPTQLRADSATPVRLAATIDKGWYIYSITQKAGGPTPMTVTVEPSPPFSIKGNVAGPAPVVVFDKEFNLNTERYEGAPSFAVPVLASIAGGVVPPVQVKVRFQACNETMCLPAHTVTLFSRVQIVTPPLGGVRTVAR